jgi:hypothetical protein
VFALAAIIGVGAMLQASADDKSVEIKGGMEGNPASLVLALFGYRRTRVRFPWLVVVTSGSGLFLTVIWLSYAWSASHG